MKWEPGAAMALVLGIGLWVALGPQGCQKLPLRENATTIELKIGSTRGVIETLDSGGERSHRLLTRQGYASPEFGDQELAQRFGPEVLQEASERRGNMLFRLLNITTWTSLVWIVVGLGGQLAFSSRFLVQWLVSEKSRKTVVPESFWWMSLIGGICLFAYFGWRQDPIGILGQSSGLVIYARNLRLIYKQRRRAERDAASISHESE